MNVPSSGLLKRFECHEIDPQAFHHREHLEVAFEMLRKYPFLEALTRYAGVIQALAIGAGAPEKFNLTITLAFLSLIAERMLARDYSSAGHFLSENADLGSSRMLEQRYTRQRLDSPLAREVFLLPDRA